MVFNFTLWVFCPFYRGVGRNLLQDTAELPCSYHSNSLNILHGSTLGEFFLAYPLSHLSTLDSLNRYFPVAVLAFNTPLRIALRIVESERLEYSDTSFSVSHLSIILFLSALGRLINYSYHKICLCITNLIYPNIYDFTFFG